MQSTMMDRPLLLDDLLERAGRQFRDTEIVTNLPDKSRHRYTYEDFHRRATTLAQGLLEAGLQPGDRVATLSWNHYVHLECYFGIPAAAGVLHTLNLRLPPDDIAWIANDAEDRFLIIDDVLLPLYEKFADKVDFERIIVIPLADQPVPEGMESYEDFLAGVSGTFEYPEKSEYDACGMCYTSGTTGKPKGVVYSHRSTVLHAMAGALPDTVGTSFNDAVLPVVPMFHANAWGLPYTATMTGSKQVYPGPHLDAVSLLDLFQDEGVTVSGGVPTIWMSILDALDAEPQRWTLPRIRMVVGGSAVPESMIRRFDDYGLDVLQGWGMTETSPLASVSRLKPRYQNADPDTQYRQRAKAGIPSPFVDLRIVAEDGTVQPWDDEAMGEIQVRGPWVTGAYFGVGSPEDKFTSDGWLRTGDVATVDRDAYIHITDRTKDLIKSGGEWISSVHLENAIMAHPDVAEAAVIAKAHPKWGERPLACVVRREGSDLDEAKLNDFLRQSLEKWMLPEGYAFIDEVPRTSTGKFNKLALRQEFQDRDWDAA